MESVFDIMDMEDEERNALLQLTDAQMAVSVGEELWLECRAHTGLSCAGRGAVLQPLPQRGPQL